MSNSNFLPTFTVALFVAMSIPLIAPAQVVPASDSRQVSLELPTGIRVPATLVYHRSDPPPVAKSDSLMQMYEPLVNAANNGNVSSAAFLGRALRLCNSAFTSEAELEAAVADLYTTGIRTYGDNREPVQTHGLANHDIELAMRKQFHFCQGIPKSETKLAANWTRLAADQGDYFALKDWIGIIGENDESFHLWHEAFSRGYVLAAQELVYYYLNGISREMAGKPDHFLAYVYQAIALKVKGQDGGSILAPGSTNMTIAETYDLILAEMGQNLGPDLWRKADETAAAILLANENCCILFD